MSPPRRRAAEIADNVKDGRYVELDGVGAPRAGRGAGRGGRRSPPRHFLGEEPSPGDDSTVGSCATQAWPCAGRCSATRTSTGPPPPPPTSPGTSRSSSPSTPGAASGPPGLDRRSRSLVTLTALVARGHHEELAMHVRAALRNGLTVDEIKEVIVADRRLLWRPRRQHRLPHRPAGTGARPRRARDRGPCAGLVSGPRRPPPRWPSPRRPTGVCGARSSSATRGTVMSARRSPARTRIWSARGSSSVTVTLNALRGLPPALADRPPRPGAETATTASPVGDGLLDEAVDDRPSGCARRPSRRSPRPG